MLDVAMEALQLGQQRKEGRERVIENAIIALPDLLGYPAALAIRNCKVAPPCGLVDLVLLPQEGPVRLVLVEAKAGDAQDAASKCVGQLVMYYAGALMLGSDGIAVLKTYAREREKEALSARKISLLKLTGRPTAAAWAVMSGGARLVPEEVRLFLALDGEPHPALDLVLQVLRDRHLLPIGLVVVRDGAIVRVTKPDGSHTDYQ